MLIRSQEMGKYVQDGLFDAGLTGHDWILETGAVVQEVCELTYGKSGFRPSAGCWPCERFEDPVGQRFGRENRRDGARQFREFLLKNKKSTRKWIFLGRHRSQSGNARRCDRGTHRNGPVA